VADPHLPVWISPGGRKALPEALEATRAAVGYLDRRSARHVRTVVALFEQLTRGERPPLDVCMRAVDAVRERALFADDRVERGVHEVAERALGAVLGGSVGDLRGLRGAVWRLGELLALGWPEVVARAWQAAYRAQGGGRG
jgi:hypothetical protein